MTDSSSNGASKPDRNTQSDRVTPKADQPSASPLASQRAAAILDVLAGQRTTAEAATALEISVNHYYLLERKALKGLTAACEPQMKGPQGPNLENQLQSLQHQLEQCRRECLRQAALVRATQRAVGLSAVPEPKKSGRRKTQGTAGRKRRPPTVRALRAAETLRGQMTIPSACQVLGICESRFHALRQHWLQQSLELLEPRQPGRPPKPAVDPQQVELAHANAELQWRLQQTQVQLDVHRGLATVTASEAPAKKTDLHDGVGDDRSASKGQPNLDNLSSHDNTVTTLTASPVHATGEAVSHSCRVTAEHCHSQSMCQSTSTDQRVRRWAKKQQLPRQREQLVRELKIEFAGQLVRGGATWCQAAACLDVSARTLRHWRQCAKKNGLVALPRGRKVLVTPIADRNRVFRILDEITGPTVGIPTLQAMFPDVPRVVLQEMLVRFRRWWRKKNALDGHRLTWHAPGTVWAMDYTKTPFLIDGQTQIIFTVRDLASRYHLCWIPVPDERAATLIPILQSLFTAHGRPLVLKSDNGSAFIAAEVQEELATHRVWPLFSPPRRPKYNGALERSNTTMKQLTHTAAVASGHPHHWTSEDLARARKLANGWSRPWGAQGPTPEQRWQRRPDVDELLRDELAIQMIGAREAARRDLGLAEEVDLAVQRRAVDRLALSRCLQQLALLTLTPIRRIKRLTKRPSSDTRAGWFGKSSLRDSAVQSSALNDRQTMSLKDLDHRLLALSCGDSRMRKCPEVRQPRAPAPYVPPPKRRARAILSWLRRPITLLINLSKAARIS